MGPTCRRSFAAALAAVVAVWASVAAAAPITLSDAIDRALRVAPSVDIAAAASDMSAAHVREQRAPLFPTVGTGVEYFQAPGYDPTISNRGLSTALLTLDYTAWDWGRREARLRAAQYVVEASRLGVAAARAQIVFDTTIAYFDLLRAHDAQNDLRASLERLNRYVITIDALKKNGRMTPSDVLKARTARDTTELALDVARGNVERASATLGALIGQPGQAELDIAPVVGVMPKPSGDIAQSAVIQAARRAILSATSQIQAARPSACPPSRSRSQLDLLESIRPRPSNISAALHMTESSRCRSSTAASSHRISIKPRRRNTPRSRKRIRRNT